MCPICFYFLCFVHIVFIPLYFHIFSVLNLHTFILCKLFLFSQYFKCPVFQIWLKFYFYRLFQLLVCARIILFLTFFQILKHISNYIKSILFCILQSIFFLFLGIIVFVIKVSSKDIFFDHF